MTIKTPLLTADIIIELVDRPGQPIVLIERKNPPLGWAIPGGFVDQGEWVEDAARREAWEETGLKVRLKTLLGLYSNPNRDPRFHTVTALYVAESQGEPKAMDDAKSVQIVALDAFPKHLAFDHELLLADYLVYRQSGQMAPLRGRP